MIGQSTVNNVFVLFFNPHNKRLVMIMVFFKGSSAPVTVFKGSKRPYMKECILIVNHDTGEYRLEKLNSNIAVKKTRWVEHRKMLTNHVTT